MNRVIGVGLITIVTLGGQYLAADVLDERAAKLATAIGISTNTVTPVASRPLFSGKVAVPVGEFLAKQRIVAKSEPGRPIGVDILDTNAQVVAGAQVRECASFKEARTALLNSLVLNSMTVDLVAQMYEVRTEGLGDLCIVKKTVDKVSGKFTSDATVIYFVRGNTMVSVYPVGQERDIWKVAKVLDAAVSGVAAGQRTSPDR